MNVEYDNQEMNEQPPQHPDISRLTRHILFEKPRVTKFQIDWDDMPQNTGFSMNENANPNVAQANTEGLLEKGTQLKDRQELMNATNLAEAAQNFQGGNGM